MKKALFPAIILSVLLTATLADARRLAADSKITDVTVFNDRAMVKRTALVRLEQGENVVTFAGLPLHIAEETLRAEGKGTAAARISGISVNTVFLDESSEKRIREIEKEIESLERGVQKINAKITSLAAQKAFIDSIRVGWGERISKELSVGKPLAGELTEANRFIGDGIFRIEEGSHDAAAERKPLTDKIAALRKQLAALNSGQKQEVRSVELTIDAPRAMDLTVELSYLVMQAKWEPVYDIRLAPDGKSAELVYRATVSQRSGEDWRGVNLSLSTAAPAIGSAPPELKPWRVYFREPYIPAEHSGQVLRKALAPMPAAAPQMLQAADSAEGEPTEMLQMSAMGSQVQEGQTSVLFVVPKPVDVPADGSRQSSLIALERVPLAAEFVTVPKLSPRVFLKSEVTNMTAYPLLAGTVNVFNDNAFVGRSYLKTVAAGEKFDLFFGVDDALKVKRKTARVRKDAGLLGGNQVSWRTTAEVDNYKSEEVALTFSDQIPVAGNEEIKVKLNDAQPKPDEIRQDGVILWKLRLKPGEKRKLTYQIDVEYPQGREIIGAE
jgi:uncharacterized protein (TIGR02231 family)